MNTYQREWITLVISLAELVLVLFFLIWGLSVWVGWADVPSERTVAACALLAFAGVMGPSRSKR